MKVYTELDVRKESRKSVSGFYEITKNFPKEETYGLMNQMCRCSVSITSNIAEGSGRRTSADTIQFLHISRGSLYELETQVFIALDLKYIFQKDFDDSMN